MTDEKPVSMKPFRRVDDRQAGPRALGILVTPGQRSLVILRPRALLWDLLPLQPVEAAPGGPSFAHFERAEAARLARQVHIALEEMARDASGPLEIYPNPWGEGHILRLHRLGFWWTACLRRPGKPYEPMVFAQAAEAEEAAQRTSLFVCPAPDAGQEYYFNTQHLH